MSDDWPVRDDERYQDVRKLGMGGMGEVSLVRDVLTGKLWCRKRPSGVSVEDQARFRREIEALRNWTCGDVVQYADWGRDREGLFLILPYYQRGTLHQKVKDRGPLSDGEMYELARRLGGAILYLHEKNILHRDIKPANVLLTDDDQPVLADFGLVRLGGGSTITGGKGTFGYMAPEVEDGGEGTRRADIYSLGKTLRFALTQSPDGHEARMPEPWRSLILRCTERKPELRLGDAREFLAELERVRQTPSSGADHRCPVCNVPTDKEAQHCGACGAALTEPCGNCEERVRRGVRHCDRCGTHLERWREVEVLNHEATRCVRAARFDEALGIVGQMLELEPNARRFREPIESLVRKVRPRVDDLRRKARASDAGAGPMAGLQFWRDLLSLCPDDEEAQECVRDPESRVQDHLFQVALGQLDELFEAGKLEEAQQALRRLWTMARTSRDSTRCQHYADELRNLREARRDDLRQQVAASLGEGDLVGAREALDQLAADGMPEKELHVLRKRVANAERTVRRAVWRRDLGVTVAVLVVAAGAILAMFAHRSQGFAAKGRAALAQGDFAVAAQFFQRATWLAEPERELLHAARLLTAEPDTVDRRELWGLAARSTEPAVATALHEAIRRRLRSLLPSTDRGRQIVLGSGFHLTGPLEPGLELLIDGSPCERVSATEFRLPDTAADGIATWQVGFVDADGRRHDVACDVVRFASPPKLTLAPRLQVPLEVDVTDSVDLEFEVAHLDAGPEWGGEVDLRVDGQTVDLECRSSPASGFRARWIAEAPGQRSVVVSARNAVGQEARVELQVVVRRPQPAPLVMEVAEPSPLTNKADQQLEVRTNADLVQSAGADGSVVEFARGEDGVFRGTVELNSGRNTLRVTAVSNSHSPPATVTRELEVELDQRAPTLQGGLPCVVEGGATLALEFDEPLRTGQRRVVLVAPQEPGRHSIPVDACDRAGNGREMSLDLMVVKIYRRAIEPDAGEPLACMIRGQQIQWATNKGLWRARVAPEGDLVGGIEGPLLAELGDLVAVRFSTGDSIRVTYASGYTVEWRRGLNGYVPNAIPVKESLSRKVVVEPRLAEPVSSDRVTTPRPGWVTLRDRAFHDRDLEIHVGGGAIRAVGLVEGAKGSARFAHIVALTASNIVVVRCR